MSVARIVVVGAHRARLAKVMQRVEELEQEERLESDENIDEYAVIKYLPCLAKMDMYKAEDGSRVRYLSNLVYHDGSTLATFLDDEEIRDTISYVSMIGYEWHEADAVQIKRYFEANNLNVEVDCVLPNSQFATLQDEMDYLKQLDEETRNKMVEEQRMGLGKMVRFVINAADHIREEKKEEHIAAAVDHVKPVVDDVENEEGTPEPQPVRPPPDESKTRYACRMCRSVLFGADDLVDHVQNLHHFKKGNFQKTRKTVACQSLFCRDSVLEAVSSEVNEVEGKLLCPKCTTKLGHLKWAGAQCSCGTWVTPAIQVPLSKVDVIQPVTTLPCVPAINPVVSPTWILPSG